jgi:hypothetical protein
VVAAAVAVQVRCSAEFAGGDDERRVQHAPLPQIFDEGGE